MHVTKYAFYSCFHLFVKDVMSAVDVEMCHYLLSPHTSEISCTKLRLKIRDDCNEKQYLHQYSEAAKARDYLKGICTINMM